MSADTHAPDTQLATVAGNLYGVLMEAREPLRTASAAYLLSGDGGRAERTAELVDRVDAALAEAADYLQGEG